MNRIIPSWAPAARFGDWALYEMPAPMNEGYSFLWVPFKLVDTSGAKKRWHRLSTFRVYWNPIEGRRRRDRDGGRLHAQEPALEAQVDAFLLATYTRAWLLETGLADEAEIAPELARLAAARAEREAGGPGGSRR